MNLEHVQIDLVELRRGIRLDLDVRHLLEELRPAHQFEGFNYEFSFFRLENRAADPDVDEALFDDFDCRIRIWILSLCGALRAERNWCESSFDRKVLLGV